MNLHELRDVLRLKLASPDRKVLLVTRGTRPISPHPRLTITWQVPTGLAPLKFSVIIFVKPFRKDNLDTLERWVAETEHKIPVLGSAERVTDVVEAIAAQIASSEPAEQPATPEKGLVSMAEMLRTRRGTLAEYSEAMRAKRELPKS